MQHQIIPRRHRRQQAGFHFPPFLLGKDIARFAQRPGHHGFNLRRGAQIAAIRSESGNMVIAAVHRRAHQIIKPGVNQHEVAAAHLLHAANLRNQHPGFRHQETTRLDLKLHRMTQMFSDLLARGVPQAEVVIGVDRLFIFVIRDRQPAAGGDRLQILAEFNHLSHHRAANLFQVAIVDPRTDMHMNTHQLELVTAHHFQRRR